MPMKFPGTCIVCKKKVDVNEIGLWAKGIGIKHLACEQVSEIACAICGGMAGCSKCEFADSCDRSKVSQLCICKKCNSINDPYQTYQKAVSKKFPLLNIKI